MKKLLLASALLLSVSAFAQKDTIIGIPIVPVISTDLSGKSDTATHLSWVANSIAREAGKPCTLSVTLYHRNQRKYSFELTVPAETVDKWGTDNSVIDNYIFSVTRFKRKP